MYRCSKKCNPLELTGLTERTDAEVLDSYTDDADDDTTATTPRTSSSSTDSSSSNGFKRPLNSVVLLIYIYIYI